MVIVCYVSQVCLVMGLGEYVTFQLRKSQFCAHRFQPRTLSEGGGVDPIFALNLPIPKNPDSCLEED